MVLYDDGVKSHKLLSDQKNLNLNFLNVHNVSITTGRRWLHQILWQDRGIFAQAVATRRWWGRSLVWRSVWALLYILLLIFKPFIGCPSQISLIQGTRNIYIGREDAEVKAIYILLIFISETNSFEGGKLSICASLDKQSAWWSTEIARPGMPKSETCWVWILQGQSARC